MSSGKKKGLGRGLSALFGDDSPKDKNFDTKEINKISISDLSRNPFQPREFFNETKLQELTDSIKKNGVIQPIAVRLNKSEPGKYEIIAGERRWLAAQKAGLHEIPVTILDLTDQESLEVAIVENIQRDDLNPIEEARGYKRLSEEFKYDHLNISKLMSKSRSHVSNSLRLLSLPTEVIQFIEEKKLTTGHAKILVSLDNPIYVANKIIDKNLSVRQAESLVRVFKFKKGSSKISKDPNIDSLEISVTEKIGLKVFIKNNKNNRGTITLEYKDLEQLNKIIKILKSNY